MIDNLGRKDVGWIRLTLGPVLFEVKCLSMGFSQQTKASLLPYYCQYTYTERAINCAIRQRTSE